MLRSVQMSIVHILFREDHGLYLGIFFATLLTRVWLILIFPMDFTNDALGIVRNVTYMTTGNREIAALYATYTSIVYVFRLALPSNIETMSIGRMVSAVAGSLNAVFLFSIVKNISNKKTAFIATCIFITSPWVMWNDISTIASSLFITFYFAFLISFVHGRYKTSLVFALLASLTRFEGSVLFLFIFITLLNDLRKRRFCKVKLAHFLVLSGLVPLIWMTFSFALIGEATAFLSPSRIASVVNSYLPSEVYGLIPLFFLGGYILALTPLILYLGLGGLILAITKFRGKGVDTIISISLLYIVFYIASSAFNLVSPETRYLLLPGSALLMFAAFPLSYTIENVSFGSWSHNKIGKSSFLARGTTLLIMIGIVCIPMISSAAVGYDMIRNDYSRASAQQKVAEIIRNYLPDTTAYIVTDTGNGGALWYFLYSESFTAIKVIRVIPVSELTEVASQYTTLVVFNKNDLFWKKEYPFLENPNSTIYENLSFTRVGSVKLEPVPSALYSYFTKLLFLPNANNPTEYIVFVVRPT